ncbi:MAG: hypothetical protein J6Y37_01665 [Paludibacteraceae bacterium]|nr:hypothetical protein [Paludibacteraceae bacterium]
MNIRAIHVNWTKPYVAKNGLVDYRVDAFEVLTTILSAIMWKKLNGSIKLYTDRMGYAFYESLNILDVWDGGVDTETLESIPSSIDPEIYWAAAKIFAIRKEDAPLVMMDTDLMVWKSLDELADCHLAAFHRESLLTDCYIPYECLKKRSGYRIDKDWSWSVEPCNTALAYFNHRDFKNYYTQSAIDFMLDNNERPQELVSQMVFAEQRIFSMCAEKMGIAVHTFLDKPYNGETMDFTHIWGAKSLARTDGDFNGHLCESLINAILRESPSYRIPDEVFRYLQL